MSHVRLRPPDLKRKSLTAATSSSLIGPAWVRVRVRARARVGARVGVGVSNRVGARVQARLRLVLQPAQGSEAARLVRVRNRVRNRIRNRIRNRVRFRFRVPVPGSGAKACAHRAVGISEGVCVPDRRRIALETTRIRRLVRARGLG